MPQCRTCQRDLTPDECALTRRLINRGATEYLCKSCLAAHFSCSEAVLDDKIAQYKALGCGLFAREG